MNEINFKIGMTCKIEAIVTDKLTAAALGSGGIDVFSTPSMIALMEQAAAITVQKHLDEGLSTVGTEVNISHIAATPIGYKVKAIAELIEIDGRKLKFKVEAFDEKKKIGEGFHSRYIIDIQKFLSKLMG